MLCSRPNIAVVNEVILIKNPCITNSLRTPQLTGLVNYLGHLLHSQLFLISTLKKPRPISKIYYFVLFDVHSAGFEPATPSSAS